MRRIKLKKPAFLFIFLLTILTSSPFVYSAGGSDAQGINYSLRDNYFLSPDLQFRYNTYESAGFLLTKQSRPEMNSNFALVSGFEDFILESRAIPNAQSIEDVQSLLKKHTKTSRFMSMVIKELEMPNTAGGSLKGYWIGQQSFPTLQLAKASLISIKTVVEAGGGNYDKAVELIETFALFEPKEVTEEIILSRSAREEAMAIKLMDWFGVGEKLYGPMHSPHDVWGEPILWQSFGETSFRFTNLERDEYTSQVGFWSNRMVFKGIRGPGTTTFDPYFEVTPTLESNGIDFKTNLQLWAGVEWYPLIRNAPLQNIRPYGIPLTDFIRNYRFFVQYGYRENIKDEILGSADWDLEAGIDIFYEWGFDLPTLGAKPIRTRFSDYLHDYVWGEYFGSYSYKRTDFSSIPQYDSFILNSSLILGVKWPTIPLPHNPINDELTLMPYLKFEHVTNPNHPLHFQNQYFVAAGVRVMPFRTWRFAENEWLFKTKLFFEYVGVGGVIWPSANTPVDVPNHDVRFGLIFSHKRF